MPVLVRKATMLAHEITVYINLPRSGLNNDVRHARVRCGIIEEELEAFSGNNILNTSLLLNGAQCSNHFVCPAVVREPNERNASVLFYARCQSFLDRIDRLGDEVQVRPLQLFRINGSITVLGGD